MLSIVIELAITQVRIYAQAPTYKHCVLKVLQSKEQ